VPEGGAGGNPGALKWAVHGGKCLKAWNEFGAGCHTCIRVCPFNKPDTWLHELTKVLIGGVRSKSLDKLLVTLDDASGYGKPNGQARDPRKYWNLDNFVHIKG
jgi:hypothetical protein